MAAHFRVLPAVPAAAAALPFVDEPFEDALEAALATELALPVPEAEDLSFFFFPDDFLAKPLTAAASDPPTPPPPPVEDAGDDAPESNRLAGVLAPDEGLVAMEPREADAPNPESRV